MSERSYSLNAVNSRDMGVCVTFDWIGDRFSQTLFGIRKDSVAALARSVDAKDLEGWPLSFPIQEIRQTEDDGRAHILLLMGSAAHGHWSATVRVGELDQTNPNIEFDVAVRLHRMPPYLGVAYKILEDAAWTETPGGLARAHRASHSAVIAAPLGQPGDDNYAPADFLKAVAAPDDAATWLFMPTNPLPSKYPATFRWKYCVASALA